MRRTGTFSESLKVCPIILSSQVSYYEMSICEMWGINDLVNQKHYLPEVGLNYIEMTRLNQRSCFEKDYLNKRQIRDYTRIASN